MHAVNWKHRKFGGEYDIGPQDRHVSIMRQEMERLTERVPGLAYARLVRPTITPDSVQAEHAQHSEPQLVSYRGEPEWAGDPRLIKAVGLSKVSCMADPPSGVQALHVTSWCIARCM